MAFVRQYVLTLPLSLFLVLLLYSQSIQLSNGRHPSSYNTTTTTSTTTTKTTDWGTVLSARKKQLESTCAEMGGRPKPYWSDKANLAAGFVYDARSNLAYCHVPKVASTWWLGVLARSYGLTEGNITSLDQEKILHSKVLHNSVPSDQVYPDAFKFIFVRHPLNRLVSAYVSKFIQFRERGFRLDLTRFLVLKRGFKVKEAQEKHLTFPNFVDFILTEARAGKVSYGTLHWLPYNTQCFICDTSYAMVGKLETFSEDVNYLLDLFPYMREYADLAVKKNAAEVTHTDYEHYLEQLSLEQKMGLCDVYRWDFKMFNYTCF